MRLNRWFWALTVTLVVGAAALAGCSGSSAVENVDPAGARDAIAAGAVVLDVRTAGEYQAGHIPGAVLVPDSDYSSIVSQLDRDATYVVYCATGSRSQGVVEFMRSEGFTAVKHMNRGLAEWYNQGGPLVAGTEPGNLADATGWGSGQGGVSAGVEAALANPLMAPTGLPVVVEFKTDS